MIEYCNQKFPGKSTTECYEYIKAFNFSYVLNHGKVPKQIL